MQLIELNTWENNISHEIIGWKSYHSNNTWQLPFQQYLARGREKNMSDELKVACQDPNVLFSIKISSIAIKIKMSKGNVQNSPLITMNIAYRFISVSTRQHLYLEKYWTLECLQHQNRI